MRQQYAVAIEPYVYYHTQSPGYQVRFKKTERHGRRQVTTYELSKYFGVTKWGSLRIAREKALKWKRRNRGWLS